VKALVLLLGTVVLAGCFHSYEDPPPLDVEEAQGRQGDTVYVRGFLLEGRGQRRLCAAFAESAPPLCQGSSLILRGRILKALPPLREAAGVRWSEEPIELIGRVEGRTLILIDTS
jgi:hypothetical protein